MKRFFGRIYVILICAAMILSSSACESNSGSVETYASASDKAAENIVNGKRVYFAGPLFNQAKNLMLKSQPCWRSTGMRSFCPSVTA